MPGRVTHHLDPAYGGYRPAICSFFQSYGAERLPCAGRADVAIKGAAIMPCKSWLVAPATLGLTLAVGIWGAAQEPKDLPPTPPAEQPKRTGEAIGNAVDTVVESIKRGARATSETLREQYQRAQVTVREMGVQARIYSRLHWDKNLETSRIDLEFKDGTATLRGTVTSPHARAKAIELARDTVGVDRVDDQMTIEPISPAAPAEKTKS
jgi:hyperosmotically inducible periplasmic protein